MKTDISRIRVTRDHVQLGRARFELVVWPMIYVTAAIMHRRRTGQALRTIRLASHHSVEVVALLFPLLYALSIWWKGYLHLYDGIVLVLFYAASRSLFLQMGGTG